jgi:PTS system galactitol-specific IIC component
MKSVLEVDKDVKTRGAGTLAYALSESYLVGLLVALATAAIIFLLADHSAPLVKDFFGLEGVSLPHTATGDWFPLTMALNWLLERIPGIKRIHLDLEEMKKHLGLWGSLQPGCWFSGGALGTSAGDQPVL